MRVHEVEAEWHNTLRRYNSLRCIIHTALNFDTRPMQQAFIKASITFANGETLYLREFVDCSSGTVVKFSYSYHAQTAHENLLFRYDNAPHKPPLGFVEHKHCADGQIIAATAPELEAVLDEMLYQCSYF